MTFEFSFVCLLCPSFESPVLRDLVIQCFELFFVLCAYTFYRSCSSKVQNDLFIKEEEWSSLSAVHCHNWRTLPYSQLLLSVKSIFRTLVPVTRKDQLFCHLLDGFPHRSRIRLDPFVTYFLSMSLHLSLSKKPFRFLRSPLSSAFVSITSQPPLPSLLLPLPPKPGHVSSVFRLWQASILEDSLSP